MADKTSGVRTRYKEHGSKSRRGFGRGGQNSYSRGRGSGFNLTKPKVWGKREALGSNVYSIRDARESNKYTKKIEVILNHIQVNFN